MNRMGSRTVKILRDEFLLFRSSDYIAINKKRGFDTASGKQPQRELQELLMAMELAGDSPPIPVNALKSHMSGVQILSTNPSAGKLARSMVKAGQFWRCKYWGFVDGQVKRRDNSIINIPIMNGVPSTNGETSITYWKLLKSDDFNKKISLVEFEPRTDIDNQIQIHCELALRTRLMEELGLHLYSISASFPGGENVEIIAPPIGEFKDRMRSLGWI